MENRADDLAEGDDLPLPGTLEPDGDDAHDGDPTEGPGNVSIDEPTEGALSPEEP